MTQDEIIRMAREAGFSSREDSSHMYAQSEFDEEICFEEYAIGERVARFAALVAAHEREACAEVCESFASKRQLFETDKLPHRIAAAIRARPIS